jgi:pimeloyl-ACP methyl ester carboxylesterase
VRDCKVLAKTAKIPSLWIYGDSEELHPENNIKAMYNAYEQSGGQADLLILPNTDHDTTSHQSQK